MARPKKKPDEQKEESKSAREYRERVMHHVAYAEECSGIKSRVIAKHIGVTEAAYAKYKTQSPMPPWLIPAFADLTGASRDWVLWDEGKPPATLAEKAAQQYQKLSPARSKKRRVA